MPRPPRSDCPLRPALQATRAVPGTLSGIRTGSLGAFCRSRCWLGYHYRIGNRLRNIKFLDGVKQAAQEASDRTKEQWKSILDNIPRGGTDTGAHVKETLSAHAREAQAAMRSSREAGLKVMHTLTQNYATLVSGVLIGLSEALEHGKPKTKH